MRNRFIFLTFILAFSLSKLPAQYYETGQDPASLRWMQIKTPRFTVIFPENYSAGGIKYAKALDDAYSKLGALFPDKKFRLPIVIHNYTIQSNGYVSWAPKRMELYPTPEQNTIPLAPEKQLAIHELTHVMQMESLNRDFSKVMSIFFGEQFTGVVAALLPSWFLEGDAVFAESILSQSGRGRTPSFQKQLKAMIVDNSKDYGYDKILNGSYKNFVPDDYATGFQMVTQAITRRDPQIWNEVIKFTAQYPFTLNPVNISLEKNSGLTKKTLWKETYDSLKTIWSGNIRKDKPVNYENLNPDKKGKYINYYSPVFVSDDSIIAIKTSLSDPPSFVLINPKSKTEKRIHTPGLMNPWFISYGHGRLAWVETRPDPRWENREYSVIMLMNTKNWRVIKISHQSRYLAVAISPDGRKIAAVENTSSDINNLVFLESGSGEIIETVHAPENVFLQHPQWSDDGKQITFITLADGGEGIVSYEPGSRQWKNLLAPGKADLQSSFFRNDSLFFISSLSGTDNIYTLTADKKINALTRSKFGVTDGISGGTKVYFTNYTFLGNEICSTGTGFSPGIAKENFTTSSFLINKFNLKLTPSTEKNNAYTIEPYRKLQHLFRFHSWMPFYADIEELKTNPASIRPGVTVLTQNTLSTLTSTFSYEYSTDKRNVFHSWITWNGWYPVIESRLDYGIMPSIYKLDENVPSPSDIHPGISLVNRISLPLMFRTGKFSQFLQPSISTDYLNWYVYVKSKNSYDYGQTIVTGRLYFSNYHVSALRDIFPRWAQIMDFNYCFAPFDKEIYGSDASLKTIFYSPGIFPGNGLRIRIEYEEQQFEKQQIDTYLYGNFSDFPRGYNNLLAKQISFLSADYAFPLAYPDFNIASLLYVKRIRATLFYDYASGPGNEIYSVNSGKPIPLFNSSSVISLRSFGFELLADLHILRIPYMISGGIQSAWKNVNESPVIGVLFNINLYGLTFGKKQI